MLLISAAGLSGADKKQQSQSYGLVAGTVFEETGRSLPRADVTLEPTGEPAQELRKFKKTRYTTDARGEFAIRVPAVKQDYVLTISAPGFETQKKPVTISGEERLDVFIRLQPASK